MNAKIAFLRSKFYILHHTFNSYEKCIALPDELIGQNIYSVDYEIFQRFYFSQI